MRQRSSVWRLIEVLGGCGLLSIAACQSPGSQRIVGPDGSAMAHVHCGADQGLCFRMAGELCPSGYELKPVLAGNDGNFLVRCRTREALALKAACPAPSPSPAPVAVTTHTPGLMDPWPPAAEPAPAAYPWPSPASSAAGRSNAPSNVDVGY